MIRELCMAAAIAGATLAMAPAAAGEPAYHDDPGRYDTDVPGMNYDAHRQRAVHQLGAVHLRTRPRR